MMLTRSKRARIAEAVVRVILGAAAALVVGAALFLVLYIVWRGLPGLSWEFLTEAPKNRGREGGIYPALIGTLYVVLGTAAFAVPLGVLGGVYLAEYAPKKTSTRMIRLAVANMAGVPSIVYGLFGLAAFVLAAGFGRSVIAASLTLTCMTLPVVITATEEALRQVPMDLRHAALALGASKIRTVLTVALPAAAPGIVTGVVLGLARAAGETAPILFTGAVFQMRRLPDGPGSQFMALPYHIYTQVTSVPNWNRDLVWGTALVLVLSVSAVSALAAIWRSARRRRISW
ncbi:phosphate ABC transporter permease PstA [Coriobacteriia bacterium Es71-Z0120]|uniref:phosphate ABC transporter permease PstA n=1 Tax=Parvivirga hydrogeniphila TaxID=2939460 RepID=UPI002260E694|nr:phosphate ABC transporter permease PstA [Parvivirga hydrogeniphila]MCL4078613.1 phosphate ABC transporter permease PstA [Parvivirga hydrogeniphila]